MSKEKQIEELAEILRKVCDATPNGKCMSKLCCACRAETVIEAGYRKQSEWVSVEERLPEVAGRAYLVWDNVQKTAKKRFFYRLPPSIPLETYPYRREYFGNSADYKRYTHWMPLPEPPDMKGGSE